MRQYDTKAYGICLTAALQKYIVDDFDDQSHSHSPRVVVVRRRWMGKVGASCDFGRLTRPSRRGEKSAKDKSAKTMLIQRDAVFHSSLHTTKGSTRKVNCRVTLAKSRQCCMMRGLAEELPFSKDAPDLRSRPRRVGRHSRGHRKAARTNGSGSCCGAWAGTGGRLAAKMGPLAVVNNDAARQQTSDSGVWGRSQRS